MNKPIKGSHHDDHFDDSLPLFHVPTHSGGDGPSFLTKNHSQSSHGKDEDDTPHGGHGEGFGPPSSFIHTFNTNLRDGDGHHDDDHHDDRHDGHDDHDHHDHHDDEGHHDDDGGGCNKGAALDVTKTDLGVTDLDFNGTDVGDQITYNYTVTNSGNVTLTNVTLVDDNGTPGDTSDDVTIDLSGLTDEDGDTFADDLAVGASATGSYDAELTLEQVAAGIVTNIATGTGTDPNDKLVTGEATDTVILPPPEQTVLALHIEKDATEASVSSTSDVIHYTMAVTNTGNAAIAGVSVDDPSVSDEAPVLSGGYNVGDTDTDGLLDVNETWQFTASHQVTQDDLDAGDDIANTATASGTDATSDDDSATVAVEQSKALHIEKDATEASVSSTSDVIHYTMAVTNTGNAAIAGVSVDDPSVSDEAPVLSGGYNVGDTDTDGLLDVNETWQFTASHQVTQDDLDAGDDIANTATASGTDATSDDDSATVAVEQSKALHIEKDATEASVSSTSDVIHYTMAVTNTGNAAIAGVSVDDPSVSDEAPVLSGGYNVGDTDTDGLLDVNETWQFTASHQVTQDDLDAGDDIANTATASGTDATSDDDSATVAVEQSKALHIEKDATEASVSSTSDVIHYTMAVTNTGNAAIAGVSVDDPSVSDEAPVLSGGYNVGDTDTDGLLDVNETWQFTASHQVTQDDLDAGDDIANTATASGTDATSDDDSATVAVEQSKALHIEKDATEASVSSTSDVIHYTMAVTNTGNAAIAGVSVDDPSVSDEAPVLSGGYNVGDTDTDGLLDVNETWQFTASHQVTQDDLDAGDDIANTATASGTDATSDDDSATVAVEQSKALHIEKDATEASVSSTSDVIHYTMAVTNTGNAAIAGVSVDDPSVSDEAPVLSGGYNVGDTDTDGLLDVNETWQFTASHQVTQDDLDAGDDIANTATASGTDATSDDDSATVAVEQSKALHIEKDATEASVSSTSDVIHYTMAVTNTGNAAIAGVSVDDPSVSDEAPVLSGGYNVGDTDTDGLLDVNETWQFTASHQVTQDDLDAGDDIVNTATASGTDATSDDDSATVAVLPPPNLFIVGSNLDDNDGAPSLQTHTVPKLGGPDYGVINGAGSDDILIGDPGAQPTITEGSIANLILVLDSSGSMTTDIDPTSGVLSRMQALQNSVNTMLDTLAGSGAEHIRVHLIDFDTNATSLGTFDIVSGGVLDAGALALAHAAVNSMTAGGFTNYEAGLQRAIEYIAPGGAVPIADADVNQLLFVSDGVPNRALVADGTSTVTGSISTTTALRHLTGTYNPSGTTSDDHNNEIAAIMGAGFTIDAVGVDVNDAALEVLDQVEGSPANTSGHVSTNANSPTDLNSVVAALDGGSVIPTAAGNDVINGGAGNDIIFGDVPFTDTLAAAAGLSTDPSAGWQVFDQLESGLGVNPGYTSSDWDSSHSTTIAYITTHTTELAAESGRTGGNDTIDGGDGNDTIFGQEGTDTITGGLGSDTMSGGSGADHFQYNVPTEGMDHIIDFTPGQDFIDVSGAAFGGLAPGNLLAANFVSGAGATATTLDVPQFVFDTTTHILSYDADGSNSGVAVQLAKLENLTNVGLADIQVV